MKKYLITLLILTGLSTQTQAQKINFMDARWAKKACVAWNETGLLYDDLGYKWIKNHKDRGYRIIQIYRNECSAGSKVQLTIQPVNGKALCTYGGYPDSKLVDLKIDHVIHGTATAWNCSKNGNCDILTSLQRGKLEAKGSKTDLLDHKNSFNAFLGLISKIPKDVVNCSFNPNFPTVLK